MARDGKGMLGRLVGLGVRAASDAAGAVLRDPRGQEAVARAVGAAQRGKRRIEEVQARVMKAAGIPGRQEYQDLAKQLARIKRKARELAEALEGRDGSGPGGGGAGGGGPGSRGPGGGPGDGGAEAESDEDAGDDRSAASEDEPPAATGNEPSAAADRPRDDRDDGSS